MVTVRDPARDVVIDVPREHKAPCTIIGAFYKKDEEKVEIGAQW